MSVIINIIIALFRLLKFADLAKFFIKKAFLVKLLIVEGLLFALLIGYFVGILKLLIFIYSKINLLIEKIDLFSENNDEVVAWAVKISKSMGLWNAFVDCWNLFSPIYLTIFLIYAALLGIKFLMFIRKWIFEYHDFIK